ncbi:MAG: hypothetical protein JO358_20390, partial [Alphaproteobacteria bacterium]|nr:hypothetical protein [Alphaproteobacteria bacterium]
MAQGTPGTAALHEKLARSRSSLVVVADPISPGFVASLSRPGGNITGFTTSETVIMGKMVELLIEIASGLKRVALIFNADTAPGRGMYHFRDFAAATESSKLEPIAADARSDAAIE